jgi:F-type H+-transporting ATPase subunit gamma
METTEGLRNKIRTAEDLQSVVKTMKGLAAVNIRQYQRAVESLEDYSRTVELGLQALLRLRPEVLTQSTSHGSGTCAAIVFGSDQGMCGPLNREIASHAIECLAQLESDRPLIAAVGARVKMELEGAGQEVTDAFAPPGSIAQLTARVEDVLVSLELWREEKGVAQIVLFHQQPLAAASYKPRTVHLLPLDLDWFSPRWYVNTCS